MEERLVVPVWQNRGVHPDLERMTKSGNIRKRTPYNCANYVDAGGHGALIMPSLAIHPSRLYDYRLAATGPLRPLNVKGPRPASQPLAFAVPEPGRSCSRILFGGPMAGLHSLRVDHGEEADEALRAPQKLSGHEHPFAVKVQDFNPDLVNVAVLSMDRVSVLRHDKTVSSLEVTQVDAFASSPFIEGEVAAVSREALHLGDTTHQIAQGQQQGLAPAVVQDVTFWTHPRHLALITFGTLSHMDARSGTSPTKLVESAKCPYLLPKEFLASAVVNPLNVNQTLLLASDTLSVWDVRYSLQPMAVFNHYVPRPKTLLGLQVLRTNGDFLVVVRSSERSTIFDLDPSFPPPNVATRGVQLQFGYPMDLAYFYKDQCGEEIPPAALHRLRQPCAGSCLIPCRGSERGASAYKLISVSTSADWFEQAIKRTPPEDQQHEENVPPSEERTFTYGLDGPTLDAECVEKVRSAIAALAVKAGLAGPQYNGPTRTLSLARPVQGVCAVCAQAITTEETSVTVDLCNVCENVAPSLAESWACADLLRHSVELTVEEEALSKKLLGPSSGFVVSDEVKAAWGDVEWRVGAAEDGDAGAFGVQGNDDLEQREEGDNAEDYD